MGANRLLLGLNEAGERVGWWFLGGWLLGVVVMGWEFGEGGDGWEGG